MVYDPFKKKYCPLCKDMFFREHVCFYAGLLTMVKPTEEQKKLESELKASRTEVIIPDKDFHDMFTQLRATSNKIRPDSLSKYYIE